MNGLTSNQFYGGLNRRFDKRARVLRRAGFAYRIVCAGVAVFTRSRYGRECNVSASEIMHAHNRTWRELLPTLLIHGQPATFAPYVGATFRPVGQ